MRSLIYIGVGLYIGKTLKNNQSELLQAIINILAWKF